MLSPKQTPKGATTNVPSENDQKVIEDFLGRMSIEDRWKPVSEELARFFDIRKSATEQKKLLPDYCYEILDIYRRTLFKNFPAYEDTIAIIPNSDAVNGKSGKTANPTVRVDWRCLGKVVGIGKRGLQFFDLQAIPQLKAEGLLDLKPEKEKIILKLIFGERWLKPVLARLIIRPHRFIEKLRRIYFRAKILGFSEMGHMAYRAGPKAFAEFQAGLAEGQVGFLDGEGKLVGESNRSNNYSFLLLAWPEIKEMQERNPQPTRTEVFNWTKPFTKAGIASFVDIDQFRDVCEDIKLKFAPRAAKKTPMPSR